ncbi:hypothetical protein C0995_011939, partial [Termitomyces sp. Mi166
MHNTSNRVRSLKRPLIPLRILLHPPPALTLTPLPTAPPHHTPQRPLHRPHTPPNDPHPLPYTQPALLQPRQHRPIHTPMQRLNHAPHIHLPIQHQQRRDPQRHTNSPRHRRVRLSPVLDERRRVHALVVVLVLAVPHDNLMRENDHVALVRSVREPVREEVRERVEWRERGRRERERGVWRYVCVCPRRWGMDESEPFEGAVEVWDVCGWDEARECVRGEEWGFAGGGGFDVELLGDAERDEGGPGWDVDFV